MENNSLFNKLKNSINKNKTAFFTVALLLIVPIVFISVYGFFMDFNKFSVDMSAFDKNIGLEQFVSGENIQNFANDIENSIVNNAGPYTATDIIIDVIGYLLKILLAAFAVIFIVDDGKSDGTTLISYSLKRMFAVILPSILFMWVYDFVFELLFSGIYSALLIKAVFGNALLVLPSIVITLGIVSLFSSWVLSYAYYSAITLIKNRSRSFFALGYSRAILKGKKQTIKLMPLFIIAFVIPTCIKAYAPYLMATSVENGCIVFAVGELLFTALNMLFIMYLVPRHAQFEIESGIAERIKTAFAEAMRKRAGIVVNQEPDNKGADNDEALEETEATDQENDLDDKIDEDNSENSENTTNNEDKN